MYFSEQNETHSFWRTRAAECIVSVRSDCSFSFSRLVLPKRDVTDTCTFQVSKAATSALVSGLSERLEL